MRSILSEATPCPSWCVQDHDQPDNIAHESAPVHWTPDPVTSTDLQFEVAIVLDPSRSDHELLYLSAPGDGLTSVADARKLAETILTKCDQAEQLPQAHVAVEDGSVVVRDTSGKVRGTFRAQSPASTRKIADLLVELRDEVEGAER